MAGEQCDCCGRSGLAPDKVQLIDSIAYELKLTRAWQTVRHVKDSHPEYLETDDGRAWLARNTDMIKRMTAHLKAMHEDEAREQEARRARGPEPVVDTNWVRKHFGPKDAEDAEEEEHKAPKRQKLEDPASEPVSESFSILDASRSVSVIEVPPPDCNSQLCEDTSEFGVMC